MAETKLKTKEKWLREELRACRTQVVSVIQWGMTVLAAVELNLYYIRSSVHEFLVNAYLLQERELLPFSRWVIGTVLLSILSMFFSIVLRRFTRRLRSYISQLMALKGGYSGIDERIPLPKYLGRIAVVSFFAIPLFDLTLWIVLYSSQSGIGWLLEVLLVAFFFPL